MQCVPRVPVQTYRSWLGLHGSFQSRIVKESVDLLARLDNDSFLVLLGAVLLFALSLSFA